MTQTVAPEILKKTPLHPVHLELKAKMCPFGGWEMPIQYAGILEEHQAVRQRVGIFDVSHMGEFVVWGDGAAEFLARMVPGDLLNLPIGKCLYTQFTRPNGGVVDDTIIGRQCDRYLVVVNASNIEKDWDWLTRHKPEGVEMKNLSEAMAMIAVQGPEAAALMRDIASEDVAALPFFGITAGQGESLVLGERVIVSRTGYTGEDGFELYMPAERAQALWKGLLERGAPYGLKPCGLGARDTLRLEAGLPLSGHELDDETTPIESSLAWTVKSRADYLGKDVIERQRAEGVAKKLAGLTMQGKQIAREGYPVFSGDTHIGVVASGAPSPTLGVPIATAFLSPPQPAGSTVEVEIRGKRFAATVGSPVFYRRPKN